MIRAQRARHLVVWCVLTPTIIALVILAAFVRHRAQHSLDQPAPTGVQGAHP